MLLESKIQASCINYAKKLDWICCKNIKCSINGFPDLSMYKNGITIFVEFKTEIGKQSELQKYVEKQLTQQNFEYWLVRSLTDFKNRINDYVMPNDYNKGLEVGYNEALKEFSKHD